MWGWEPQEFTTYKYDDGGRLLSSLTVREPEFDEHQVALLLAHQELEHEIASHGFPLSVATDPANEGKFTGPVNPTIDFAARDIANRQNAYYAPLDAKADAAHVARPSRAGHLWGVELTD